MSHRNHRRADITDARKPHPHNGLMCPATGMPAEDVRGKAIGRARWKRLTYRSLRHTAAREVQAEADATAPTHPRKGTGRYAAPRDLVRPFRDGDE